MPGGATSRAIHNMSDLVLGKKYVFLFDITKKIRRGGTNFRQKATGLFPVIFPRKSGHASWCHFLFILHRSMVVNAGMQPIAVVEPYVSPNG